MEVVDLIGSQTLVVSSTALSLTVPQGTKWALINVQTAGIRYRTDGTDPTATVGIPVASGAVIDRVLVGGLDWINWLKKVRMIRSSGTDADVYVEFYGT